MTMDPEIPNPKLPKPQCSPKSVAISDATFTHEEAEFYHDLPPESLFKELEGLNWEGAAFLLKKSPDEASQWVVKVDKHNEELFRRLPIHEACIRRPNTDIISCLLDANPSSATEQDGHGRTPLHHACIHGAEEDIIYLLLDANPDAVYAKDFWGDTIKNSFADNEAIATIMDMSQEEISKKVDDIKNGPTKELSPTISEVSPVAVELIQTLGEELNQAQVESATAYAQRDVVLEETNDLKNQISDLHKYINECEVKHKETTTELAIVSGRNSSMRWALENLETENEGLKKINHEKDELIIVLRSLTVEGAVNLEKELTSLKKESSERKTKLQLENEKLKGAVLTLSTKLREMKDVIEDKDTEIKRNTDEYESKLSSMNKAMEQAAESYSSAQIHVKTADELKDATHRKEIERIELELSQSRSMVSNLQKDAQEWYQDKRSFMNVIDRLNKEKKSDKTRIGALEGVVFGYQERIQDLEDELETVSNKYLDVTEKLVEKAQSVGELRSKVATLSKEKEKSGLASGKSDLKYARITDVVPSGKENGSGNIMTKESFLFDTYKSEFGEYEKETDLVATKENFLFDTVRSKFQDTPTVFDHNACDRKDHNIMHDEGSRSKKHQELLENAISLLRNKD